VSRQGSPHAGARRCHATKQLNALGIRRRHGRDIDQHLLAIQDRHCGDPGLLQTLHGIGCEFTVQSKLESLGAVVQVHFHWRQFDRHVRVQLDPSHSAHPRIVRACCPAAESALTSALAVVRRADAGVAKRGSAEVRATIATNWTTRQGFSTSRFSRRTAKMSVRRERRTEAANCRRAIPKGTRGIRSFAADASADVVRVPIRATTPTE
jgi:hypothetical protein